MFGVATYLAVLVIGVALVTGTTTLIDPFKTTGVTADNVPVAELGGLRVASQTADQGAALKQALAPYVSPGSTPVLTLDALAGLTYALGGVPIGSTWNDAGSVERTAGILELACRNGDVDPDQGLVLIASRAPDREVADALRYCGYNYPSAFRRLAVPGGPAGIHVLVPTGQA